MQRARALVDQFGLNVGRLEQLLAGRSEAQPESDESYEASRALLQLQRKGEVTGEPRTNIRNRSRNAADAGDWPVRISGDRLRP